MKGLMTPLHFSTFWTKSGVHLHENEKQVAGKFECEICGKRLNGRSYLSCHRKGVHKVDAAGNPIEKQVINMVQLKKSE